MKTIQNTSTQSSEYRDLPLAQLVESPTNPRKRYDQTCLEELAQSFRSRWVLQPLLVRPVTTDQFEIVAGSRRYRAARIAELEHVPARVREMNDAETLEVQCIENLQREDIHPLEEAQGFRALLDLPDQQYTVARIAERAGGETHNAHLDHEYLAVLETESATPYFLNLHYQDVAHTMILGATGSGKSFFANFLITNLQKYQPLTYIFDLGGSYESLTKLFDGSYSRIGIERRSFTINPFRLSPDRENLQFLFAFVKVLIESAGYQMSSADERDLYEQIGNLYEVDPEQRRLFTLANILNRRLAPHLHKWVEGGQYSTLFDNVEDNLTFSAFQTFDFEGMDKYPQILEPFLFYVLHRANASIYDPALDTRFKVFVMDEAWRFLKNATIRQYITGAVKTWRKRNAALILATQSSDDLERSEMLSIIVESCATKMFLANPGMDVATYREIFHLNETEAGLIAGLAPKQQILIKRPDFAKVVNLNVDRVGYWLYTSNPYDNQRRREAFEQHGFERGLEILARSSQ